MKGCRTRRLGSCGRLGAVDALIFHHPRAWQDTGIDIDIDTDIGIDIDIEI